MSSSAGQGNKSLKTSLPSYQQWLSFWELHGADGGMAARPCEWPAMLSEHCEVAREHPVPELPDELIGADSVKRVKDNRGDNFVAYFPRRLKG